MKICKKSKGFTLIELMACVAILGILMAALSFFFDGTLKLYANQNARTTIQFDARRALTSITEDVRNASSVDKINSNSLEFTDRLGKKMEYSCDASANVLMRTNITNPSNQSLISNIENVRFEGECSQPGSTNPDILVIYLKAQMKNSSAQYDVSSSVKLSQSVSIKFPSKSMDLSILERNVMNIINPDFVFNLKNITINTAEPQNGVKNNLFFQCKTFDFSGMSGDNLHGDLIVKANTMNWGNVSLTISSENTGIFDVANFEGTPNALNSTNYGNDRYPAPNGVNVWNKNSNYSELEWRDIFNQNDNRKSITNFVVNTLKDKGKIDFSKSAIDNKFIHYYSDTNNEISLRASGDYDLNDCTGKASISRANTTDGEYEYIICHGPLKISSSDSNSSFKFRGIIYCDDVVTFDHIAPAFKGILISRGVASNLDLNEHENWIDMQFDNNNGDLSKINELLNQITE